MSGQIFHRNNFHKNTFCIFTEVSLPEITSLQLGYKSKSGSSYYFSESGVYRLSNHWGRAANCKWRLHSVGSNSGRTRLGYAAWTAFHRDNDFEKLYYIEADPESNTVLFQHKDSENYKNEVLRNASETTKRIKQIRHLLENQAWMKYYPEADPKALKERVIAQMIQTDLTLQQIKAGL